MTSKEHLTKNMKLVVAMAVTLAMVLPGTGSFYASATDAGGSSLPSHVLKAQQYIGQQIHSHPGWIGIVSWNSTGYTVDYLGPENSNPYKTKVLLPPVGFNKTKAEIALGPLTGSTILERGVAPQADRISSTSEYKEVEDFNSEASSVSTTDYYQILNAMNSDNSYWIQVGLTYDIAGFYSSTPSWRVTYQDWSISDCTVHINSASVPQTESAGDLIESYIRADTSQAGYYVSGVTDINRNNGAFLGFSIANDNGHNINLSQQHPPFGCTFPSGPWVEEVSSGTAKYNFGTQSFPLGFFDTSTSSKTTSVIGWNSPVGDTCITVSPNPPPVNPAKATFVYNC